MRKRGFTLIELLVVVAIVAVLAALLLPAVRVVRDAAYGVGCRSNQRQITTAVLAYIAEHDGILPDSVRGQGGYEIHSWMSDASCGQYLGIDAVFGVPRDGSAGPPWLIRCRLDRQSPTDYYGQTMPSFGLNQHLALAQGDDQFANGFLVTAISRCRPSALMPIVTDAGGQQRWDPGDGDPAVCPPNRHPELAADWGDATRLPIWWVPRHRGGANAGFLDGHVRWSASLSDESRTGTIRCAPR